MKCKHVDPAIVAEFDRFVEQAQKKFWNKNRNCQCHYHFRQLRNENRFIKTSFITKNKTQ